MQTIIEMYGDLGDPGDPGTRLYLFLTVVCSSPVQSSSAQFSLNSVGIYSAVTIVQETTPGPILHTIIHLIFDLTLFVTHEAIET